MTVFQSPAHHEAGQSLCLVRIQGLQNKPCDLFSPQQLSDTGGKLCTSSSVILRRSTGWSRESVIL